MGRIFRMPVRACKLGGNPAFMVMPATSLRHGDRLGVSVTAPVKREGSKKGPVEDGPNTLGIARHLKLLVFELHFLGEDLAIAQRALGLDQPIQGLAEESAGRDRALVHVTEDG